MYLSPPRSISGLVPLSSHSATKLISYTFTGWDKKDGEPSFVTRYMSIVSIVMSRLIVQEKEIFYAFISWRGEGICKCRAGGATHGHHSSPCVPAHREWVPGRAP